MGIELDRLSQACLGRPTRLVHGQHVVGIGFVGIEFDRTPGRRLAATLVRAREARSEQDPSAAIVRAPTRERLGGSEGLIAVSELVQDRCQRLEREIVRRVRGDRGPCRSEGGSRITELATRDRHPTEDVCITRRGGEDASCLGDRLVEASRDDQHSNPLTVAHRVDLPANQSRPRTVANPSSTPHISSGVRCPAISRDFASNWADLIAKCQW